MMMYLNEAFFLVETDRTALDVAAHFDMEMSCFFPALKQHIQRNNFFFSLVQCFALPAELLLDNNFYSPTVVLPHSC